MKRSADQNRLVVQIADECLTKSGFTNVGLNADQGTFPDVYATAGDGASGIEYLIGITGRVEAKEDGTWNPQFNLVRTDDDRRRAREMARSMNRELSFVVIALRQADGSYAAYFGQLNAIGFPRAIPMLPSDRSKYRLLAPYTPDARVKELLAS